jgi:hypothetical protein
MDDSWAFSVATKSEFALGVRVALQLSINANYR